MSDSEDLGGCVLACVAWGIAATVVFVWGVLLPVVGLLWFLGVLK